MSGLWVAGVILTGWFCVWARKRLVRERARREVRSSRTALLIWLSYLSHLALTFTASLFRVWPVPAPRPGSVLAGAVFLGAGLLFFVGGSMSFGSLARMSGRLDNRLVTGGIYRWSRNPQNAGWMAALLGISLMGGSLLALLLTGAFWAAFVAYVRQEERQLEDRFGDEYRKYRERSHRYFGPMRRA